MKRFKLIIGDFSALAAAAVYAVAILCVPGAALGQAGKGGRVGVVDVALLFDEYQRQKDLTEEMKSLRQALDDENRSRLQKIDAKQKEIDLLNPDDPAFLKKMREVLQMQIEYKNWFDVKQAELSREVAVWTSKIYKEITVGIEQIADREGFDLVLYREQFPGVSVDPEEIRNRIRNRTILYARNTIDLTTIVLEKLNADYRSLPSQPMLSIP